MLEYQLLKHKKLNIWLIEIGETSPLDRKQRKMSTFLLSDKLIERGHSVLWWISAFDHFKKNWIFKKDTEITLINGVKVYALKGIGYKKNISLSRYIDHRIISWKFKKIASKMPKPDIIVTAMPPHDLAYQAVMFAKKNKIPVLVDIKDPWPDIFLQHIPNAFRGIARKLLFMDFYMIRTTMQMADGLIAVTNTFLEWGLKYANREKTPFDKVFPLSCQRPNIQNLSNIYKFTDVIEKLKDKFIIFFVGAMTKTYHDPSILLEVAKKLKNEKIHFVIAGTGELFDELKKASENLNNVTLTGWLNQEEIELWLNYAKVGVCPATKDVILPTNKICIYLSASLPVISAFGGELKELIEKYQIGFYYPPNDVDALENCILKLYNNPQLYKTMSENAKRVFDEMFDADKINEQYADHIEKVYVNYKK
jgi:glycosyltransferase involved in cell wall biosynthesis